MVGHLRSQSGGPQAGAPSADWPTRTSSGGGLPHPGRDRRGQAASAGSACGAVTCGVVSTLIMACMMATPSATVANDATASNAGEGEGACIALKIGQPFA